MLLEIASTHAILRARMLAVFFFFSEGATAIEIISRFIAKLIFGTCTSRGRDESVFRRPTSTDVFFVAENGPQVGLLSKSVESRCRSSWACFLLMCPCVASISCM